jgi:glycoprotein endo-alpha-1,2-mannosidase
MDMRCRWLTIVTLFMTGCHSEPLPTPAVEPTIQLTDPYENEYIVIAQLNFWYYGSGQYGGFENPDGSRVTPLTPLLGATYRASDPSVVYRQIEWAVQYGVDAFSIEWTTPRGIGCCGSMEDTLDDVFLKAPNIYKVRWVVFYDFVLRLHQTSGLEKYWGSFDFNEPDVYKTFVADFKHFAQKYFGHPQYLTIDGRPVIYIWATNAYVGNLEGAIRDARREVAKLGYDVFIVGDEVCLGCFNREHAALFDGNTTFTFLIPGIDWYSLRDVGDAAHEVDNAFQWWRDKIAGLRVTGRDELVNFQPAWAPQYDETHCVFSHPKYVPAMSKEQVVGMAEVARKHAQPVGAFGQKLIWLNTWNNWAETTTVEPTAILGEKYPAGNYQFDMLEVVREVFGVETYTR